MKRLLKYISVLSAIAAIMSCANVGRPTGGAYDETPPKFIKATPAMGEKNVKTNKIRIQFDEYLKLNNPSENVVISPPQKRSAEINAIGKSIQVNLTDTLIPDKTYTIDFGDAIEDNNEGNPLYNFVYSFSTGNEIDTLEVSGTVLNAQNLEPVKGIMVGLYSNLEDSAFTTSQMERVGMTDSRGWFRIRGIKEGRYRIYALQDMDQNYTFNQKSEMIGFTDSIIVPYSRPDVRMDTLWVDTATIDTVIRVPYTHFYPDNILIRCFQEDFKMQQIQKSERNDNRKITVYLNRPADSIPRLEGLNFDSSDAFITERVITNDTITWWIKDSAVYNTDTLSMKIFYMKSDSNGILRPQTDTLNLAKKFVRQTRKKKNDDEDELPPAFKYKFTNMNANFDGYKDIFMLFNEPVAHYDRKAMHIAEQADTLWTDIPFNFEQDSLNPRLYRWIANWEPQKTYRITVDSAAFTSIYGLTTTAIEQQFKINPLESYGIIVMKIHGIEGNAYAELLNSQDAPTMQVPVKDGNAIFEFLKPGKYYVRLCKDDNGDGKWTTGNYEKHIQPETVYYYPGAIELKAMWTIEQDWFVNDTPADKQKPDEIKKQKPEQKKRGRTGQQSSSYRR